MATGRAPATAGDGAAPGGELVVMGRVAGPFGVKGWIKVQPFTQTIDGLLQYPAWWLGRDGRWERRRREDGSVHGRSLLAKLQGCDHRDAAVALKGLEIAVTRAELPANAAGEHYWKDLVGLLVANREGQTLGEVAGLLETGAHQVLVVRGERERLIPFVESVVLAVDVAGGRITVDWGADF